MPINFASETQRKSDLNDLLISEARNESEQHDSTWSDNYYISDSLACEKWEFVNFLAFWASILFLEGSLLFAIGSICLFPSVLRHMPEWATESFVDWVFLIGAWIFTAGNYALYFLLLNKHADGKLLFFVPRKGAEYDWGLWAAIFNCAGALCFNVNTMVFVVYGELPSLTAYNIWYVFTGGIGSLFFAIGGLFEGFHNDFTENGFWREPGSVMSWLNMFGGIFFAVAYFCDFNKAASDDVVIFMGVALPFTLGSFCFFIASWISIYMWKMQKFGLGFSIDLSIGGCLRQVSIEQQVFMIVYILDIGLIYLRMALYATHTDYGWNWAYYHTVGEEFLTYHCILLLMSAIHHIPDKRPYNYLMRLMRFTALYAFVTGTGAIIELVNTAKRENWS